MRRDAADALAYGCTGLMGLHWRTDILAPNVSALAQAAWDQSWNTRARRRWQRGRPDRRLSERRRSPAPPTRRSTALADMTWERSKLSAPNGQYRVTLKFCEPHFKSAGERIFDVRVQGRTVVDQPRHLRPGRPVRRAGLHLRRRRGHRRRADRRTRSPASRCPAFPPSRSKAPASRSKINCGGPAYQDWQADAGKPRGLPCDDFYADWAQANFGLAEAGKVFAAMDGKVPQVTDGGCPSGKLTPVKTPWSSVAPQFAFVDEFEQLRPRVRGAGNLDRFDYWLNTFKYLRSLAQLRCALAKPDAAELARLCADAYRHLLATVNTPGGLAMVVNMENHPGWGPAIAKHAAQPWPKEYQGHRASSCRPCAAS